MSGSISKIPILIITLVVGFIMVTTAVLPLAADYSEAKTFTNEGYYRMSKITDESASYVIDWDKSTNVLTVNDTVIDVSKFPNSSTPVTIVGMDNLVVRFQNGLRVQWYGPSSGSSGYASTHVQLTLVSGTCDGTFSAGDDTPVETTLTYTSAFVIDPNGDYIMKDNTKTAFVNEESEFYGIGITSLTSEANIGFYIVGSISAGLDITKFRGSVTPTYSNEEITSTPVRGYIDLYSLEKMTFTANDGTGDTDVTYSYFIVPYEVSADPDNPDTFKNMVRIVPLIALVALVAAAAGMIYFKGKE